MSVSDSCFSGFNACTLSTSVLILSRLSESFNVARHASTVLVTAPITPAAKKICGDCFLLTNIDRLNLLVIELMSILTPLTTYTHLNFLQRRKIDHVSITHLANLYIIQI